MMLVNITALKFKISKIARVAAPSFSHWEKMDVL